MPATRGERHSAPPQESHEVEALATIVHAHDSRRAELRFISLSVGAARLPMPRNHLSLSHYRGHQLKYLAGDRSCRPRASAMLRAAGRLRLRTAALAERRYLSTPRYATTSAAVMRRLRPRPGLATV